MSRSTRNSVRIDRTRRRDQARQQETTKAQSMAQKQAQQRSPLIDLQDADATELFDRLTDEDVESDQYEAMSDLIAPFMSNTQMLAAHEEGEYYDDLSHELLNSNLSDRIIKSRERGRLLTGPFLEVARDVEHENGIVQSRPLGPTEKEGLRAAIEDVRTDRQSLGDGTLLEAITEMHVSSEVRREDEPVEESSGGILSTLNPF